MYVAEEPPTPTARPTLQEMTMDGYDSKAELEASFLKWRGRLPEGKHAHACPEWDDLPIDELCSEWPCECCRNNRCQEE